MSAEFTIREGHDIRELFGSGRATWAGWCRQTGLTGEWTRRTSGPCRNWSLTRTRVKEDVKPYEAKTAEGASILERLRQDGVL